MAAIFRRPLALSALLAVAAADRWVAQVAEPSIIGV
jgi:hypothetical protein